ncbi:hypothetical protein FRC00_007287 [Tulasnella sp. 408]|nr:hypothetical protein FRC00_007287 [Tulasnella sp. 408]
MPKPQVPHDEAQRNGESHEEMEAEHKAEILELKAEQAALDARKVTLKARIRKSNIKREVSPIRVPRDAGLEVIDLTLEYVKAALPVFDAGNTDRTLSPEIEQDDDAYLDQPLDLKAPGTIRVEMYRVLVTGTAKWKPYQIHETVPVVHEKSKKAGGHITQFVLPVWETEDYATRFDIISYRALFSFGYYSMAILQAEGIMPKPQASHHESQGIDESDEEIEAAHKAEILALEAEQAELDARKAVLKAKFGKPNIKREASPIRVPRNARCMVIDLTLEYVQAASPAFDPGNTHTSPSLVIDRVGSNTPPTGVVAFAFDNPKAS